jgi:hypothetical protein
MRRVRLFIVKPLSFVPATWGPDPVVGEVVDGFFQLMRCNAFFALCEISKAVVIVGVGDFATADVVGELFASALPAASPLVFFSSSRHLHDASKA